LELLFASSHADFDIFGSYHLFAQDILGAEGIRGRKVDFDVIPRDPQQFDSRPSLLIDEFTTVTEAYGVAPEGLGIVWTPEQLHEALVIWAISREEWDPGLQCCHDAWQA